MTKKTRLFLYLTALAVSIAISYFIYDKAENHGEVVLKAGSSFHTPGNKNNCKWVLHISSDITTESNQVASIQIGIPELLENGYIPGILQSNKGNTLIAAFIIPGQPKTVPPLLMSAIYSTDKLPLDFIRFRIFGSTVMSMALYSTKEKCIEALME